MARDKKTKVTLALSDQALGIIEKSATPRTRGKFVSEVLAQWAAAQALEVEAPGALERIEERLRRIEATVQRIEAPT